MGMDLLDITFRLEESFEVRLQRVDLLFAERSSPPTASSGDDAIPVVDYQPVRQRWDITAGEIHDRLCAILREQDRPVPFSSWRRVKKCLYEATGASPELITRNSWRVEDLGASV